MAEILRSQHSKTEKRAWCWTPLVWSMTLPQNLATTACRCGIRTPSRQACAFCALAHITLVTKCMHVNGATGVSVNSHRPQGSPQVRQLYTGPEASQQPRKTGSSSQLLLHNLPSSLGRLAALLSSSCATLGLDCSPCHAPRGNAVFSSWTEPRPHPAASDRLAQRQFHALCPVLATAKEQVVIPQF